MKRTTHIYRESMISHCILVAIQPTVQIAASNVLVALLGAEETTQPRRAASEASQADLAAWKRVPARLVVLGALYNLLHHLCVRREPAHGGEGGGARAVQSVQRPSVAGTRACSGTHVLLMPTGRAGGEAGAERAIESLSSKMGRAGRRARPSTAVGRSIKIVGMQVFLRRS